MKVINSLNYRLQTISGCPWKHFCSWDIQDFWQELGLDYLFFPLHRNLHSKKSQNI